MHYDPYEFLPWLNARTWTSEWPKYRATELRQSRPGAPDPDPSILTCRAEMPVGQ